MSNIISSGNEFWYEKIEGKKGKNGKQIEQIFSLRKVQVNGEKDVKNVQIYRHHLGVIWNAKEDQESVSIKRINALFDDKSVIVAKHLSKGKIQTEGLNIKDANFLDNQENILYDGNSIYCHNKIYSTSESKLYDFSDMAAPLNILKNGDVLYLVLSNDEAAQQQPTLKIKRNSIRSKKKTSIIVDQVIHQPGQLKIRFGVTFDDLLIAPLTAPADLSLLEMLHQHSLVHHSM